MSITLYSKYRRQSGGTKIGVCLTLAVIGFLVVSELDYRDAVARETATREHRNWIARNCIPQKPGQRGVIEVRPNGSTSCAVHERAGYGSAPKLVFAEVREPK